MRDKGLVSGAEEAGLCLGVITGVHRSGTTILGQFARIHRGVSVLHEPFNPRYGDRDVKRVFPAARLRSGISSASTTMLGIPRLRASSCTCESRLPSPAVMMPATGGSREVVSGRM